MHLENTTFKGSGSNEKKLASVAHAERCGESLHKVGYVGLNMENLHTVVCMMNCIFKDDQLLPAVTKVCLSKEAIFFFFCSYSICALKE